MTIEPMMGGAESDAVLAESIEPEAESASLLTRGVCIGVILLSLAVMWLPAFDQPLFPPDEGRYGCASMIMADGGSWIIPIREGQPHLTKPPLTYWLQALSLKCFGHNEFALRLPSLLAGSLTLMLVASFGWRLAGPRVGAMAAALLSMMPLFAAVSHVAITDPLLTLFWFAALAFGYSAIEKPSNANVVVFWAAIALGLLTKGPLALTPLGILIIWLLFGGRIRQLAALRPLIGLLSIVPLAIWVLLVWMQQHGAFAIWQREIIDRVRGSGDHTEPPWFYVPVFIIGFLPVTVMLVIPGWNIPFRSAWTRLRAADTGSLLGLAVIVPLILFCAMGGKLWTYLLPLAPPMALLTAMMLDRWLSGEADQPVEGVRHPEVPNALFIVSLVMALSCLGAMLYFDWRRTWAVVPVIAIPLAARWLGHLWPHGPATRGYGLAAVWLAWSLSWVWFSHVIDSMRQQANPDRQLERWRALLGTDRPQVFTFGFNDQTIGFYARKEADRVNSNKDLLGILGKPVDDTIVIVDSREWDEFSLYEAASSFERVGEWSRWPRPVAYVVRPRLLPSAPASAPAPAPTATTPQPEISPDAPTSP